VGENRLKPCTATETSTMKLLYSRPEVSPVIYKKAARKSFIGLVIIFIGIACYFQCIFSRIPASSCTPK